MIIPGISCVPKRQNRMSPNVKIVCPQTSKPYVRKRQNRMSPTDVLGRRTISGSRTCGVCVPRHADSGPREGLPGALAHMRFQNHPYAARPMWPEHKNKTKTSGVKKTRKNVFENGVCARKKSRPKSQKKFHCLKKKCAQRFSHCVFK